jgi:hypothetical protein
MSISQISSLFILFDTYILLDPHASKSKNEKGIKWLAKSESSIWSLKRSQYDPFPFTFVSLSNVTHILLFIFNSIIIIGKSNSEVYIFGEL